MTGISARCATRFLPLWAALVLLSGCGSQQGLVMSAKDAAPTVPD